MVVAQGVSFSYPGGDSILAGLDYRFERGGLHSIIGASGCGKTTLLYLIAGLLRANAGVLTVNGEAPRRGRAGTAVILQDYGLFPWKRVYENLSLGLRLRSVPKAEERRRIESVLAVLGLTELAHAYPARLSGGEKQRLAVGRALVLEPDLLLLDEPFSSLDAITREQLQNRLRAIHAEHAMTIILVTHSIEEAVYLSDTIQIMDAAGKLTPLQGFTPVRGSRSSEAYFHGCVSARTALDRAAGGGEA